MSEWLAGGAIIAVITASWGYIRQVWSYLPSLLIVRAKIDNALLELLGTYLKRQAAVRRAPFGERFYQALYAWSVEAGRLVPVLVEQWLASGTMFWVNGAPLWVGTQTTTGSTSTPQAQGDSWVYSIRGWLNLEQFLSQLVKQLDAEGRARTVISAVVHHYGTHTPEANPGEARAQALSIGSGNVSGESGMSGCFRTVGRAEQDIGETLSGLRLEELALPAAAEKAWREIQWWFGHRDWHLKRHVPWRLGCLLYGPPGNGKSSFIRAVAAELKLAIYVLHLATMRDREFHDVWQRLVRFAPCIVLLEDFHTLFDGDVANSRLGLQLDTVLQHVSGVDSADGVLLCITTNNVAKLSEAMARPGRLDLQVELANPDEHARRKIIQRILWDNPEVVESMVATTAGESCAGVQLRCQEIALSFKPSVN